MLPRSRATRPTPGAPLPVFAGIGDELRAVRDAAMYRGRDPRLSMQRRAAGSSEAVPSDGGLLVSPEFSRTIKERMYLTGEIYRRCWEQPITGTGFVYPQLDESSRVTGSRLGGVRVYSQNEADTLTASRPRFLRSELIPSKLTGLLYTTSELSQDSDAFGSWAAKAFAHELTFTLEQQIISGTGAGQCSGILSSPATITVAKDTQGAGTVISTNVSNMLARLWPASEANAVWLYNRELLPQLASLTQVVGTGGGQANLWRWRSEENTYNMLAGLPAIPSEYCSAPGTPGDIILADFSRYLLVTRESRAEMSIHVLFETDQEAFRFIVRAGGQTVDARPVTPAHGSVTTSPFVALAARS